MKTAIATGVTSGIGKSGVYLLPELGYTKLFLVARNTEKLNLLEKDLHEKFPKTEFVSKICDLSDFEDVLKLSKELERETKETGVDLFLNNAGIGQNKRNENKQGFEMHLATNFLSQVILTENLLQNLNPNSTTIFTSSEAYQGANIDYNDINLEKSFSMFKGYGNSKAYQIMYAKLLRNRFVKDSKKLYFEAIHPGLVKTGFGSGEQNVIFKMVFSFVKLFALSPDFSASHNLLAPIYEENKQYLNTADIWSNGKALSVKKDFMKEENINKLWEFTKKSVGEYLG